MPLFGFRRAYDAAKKAEEEALREEGRREGEKRGAEKMHQAWKSWASNGQQGEPPTPESIDYR